MTEQQTEAATLDGRRPLRPPPTRLPTVPPVPERARPAWAALTKALAADDALVPCTSVLRHLWTSDDPAERATAATGCTGCTVIDKCGAFADVAGIEFYVFGGRDRQVKQHNRNGEMKK